jgi:ribosomal subunit interface protein
MQRPLEIVFRGLDSSPAVDTDIHERVAKLEKFHANIISCRVVVEKHHRHHHKGGLFHVRIDLKVPDKELVVSREPGKHHAHENVYVAVRDAFNAMQRQLEEFAQTRRNHIKTHDVPPHGRIVDLVPEQDYGRIETTDGDLVYFHRNSVIDADFDKLDIGDTVHFSSEMGEAGPQASTVHIEGKHHVVG